MSFAAAVIKTSPQPVHYFKGIDNSGREAYWFIMCSKQKFMLLKARINGNAVNFADYGPIIASGFGTRPSPQVLQKLKDEYDFDAESQFNFSS